MGKTIFITGCSSGIGRATANYFQEKGWNVVATMRTLPSDDDELLHLEHVMVTELDVTKDETIASAVTEAIEHFGKIDVLLNNAGYGSYGILEATPEAAIRKQYDVNVIGTLMVTKHLLPHLRENRSGRIINISSMGGKVAFPLGTLYHGTKFAVEGMSEALFFELESVGIKVKLIEPGVIATHFEETVTKNFYVNPGIKEYSPFVDRVMNGITAAAGHSSSPLLVAETIYRAATDDGNQFRYVVGEDAKQLIDARKKLSDEEYFHLLKQQFNIDSY